MALTNLKRFDAAIPVLESIRSVEEGRIETLCYLGQSHFELADYDGAAHDFEDLLSLAPGSVFAAHSRFYLGMFMFRRGKLAWAKQEFEKCLALPDRGQISERKILEGLIKSSEGLNLTSEVARYSEMLSKT